MSSSESEEEEEEMEVDEREEEEEEDSDDDDDDDDDDESYQIPLSQEQNFVREQNIKALRDGTVTIRYASVLSNLKPPEPDEVILKRHFQPLVPGGAVQTGAQSRVVGLMFSFSFLNDSLSFPSAKKREKKGGFKSGHPNENSRSFSLSFSLFLSLSLSFPSFQEAKNSDVFFLSLSLSFSLFLFEQQLRCKERFSLVRYSSRLDRRNDPSCRKLSHPAQTRKISCSQKASQSWCCGKTRISKGRRKVNCYLR
jgi:hypothetical protein